LGELNEKIDTTSRLVNDVAVASKEQMAGVDQINDAVAQLDQMTQENAGIANQSSMVAENVSRLASELVQEADKKQFVGKDSIRRVTTQVAKSVSSFKPSMSKPTAKISHAPKPAALPTPAGSGGEWDSF
jgi:methyl-accepting chemotaxis protein